MSKRNTFTNDERAFIQRQRVLRFNSVTPSGQVHSVPICFAIDGNTLYLHRSNPNTRRWKNIEKNGIASVELDHYVDDWSENAGVLAYGVASFLDREEDAERRRALSLLKNRYVQYRSMLKDDTVIVKFKPNDIKSWSPGE